MLIIKNNTLLNVSKGAFSSLFASKGWEKYTGDDVEKPTNHMTRFEYDEQKPFFGQQIKKTEENEFFEPEELQEDFEKPLSDMTIKEMLNYADVNDIDLQGATKKDEIRQIILAFQRG